MNILVACLLFLEITKSKKSDFVMLYDDVIITKSLIEVSSTKLNVLPHIQAVSL